MSVNPQGTAPSGSPWQQQPIAIVGMGAIMPDAPTGAAFWANITGGHYSITDVPKDRWDPELYYDPDPRAPDKTYSRIGAGSVSSPGIRSAGACHCRPRSATRWMKARSGRSPRRARPLSMPGGPAGTSIPSAWPL